jgi:hypothetical protein
MQILKATIKILTILLFLTNHLLAKNTSDSTLLKKVNYSLSIAPLRILNNKWDTPFQVSKNKFRLLLALDYQQKNIPFKKAFLFYDLDYKRYISYKIGGFYKFKKNSIFKNVGLCFYNRYSNNSGKKERVKMVNESDTPYYYSIDEKIKSFGLLISTTSQIKITKQFIILICPFLGIIQRNKVRENNSDLKNTIYDKRYNNTKNVIHADLYTCLSYTF